MPHGTGEPLGRLSVEVPASALRDAEHAARALRNAQRVLVLGHVGADGDVAGSSLGLASALREMGKDVVVYNERPYPANFAWLPGGDRVVLTLDDDARFDATVVVDAADPARCGRHFPDESRRGTYIWIDHHALDNPPGDVNFIDLTSAAVGEQIALILDALAHPFSKETAMCLYASLLSDTGGFRYGNTSARVFNLAARLVAAGVEPWEMTKRLYESHDERHMRLLGHVLSGLWVCAQGRVGMGVLSKSDLESEGADESHLKGIVNHIRAIRGVEVAFLLVENEGGKTSVTARSVGNIPCAPFAEHFGGDGHTNAASFEIPLGPIEARQELSGVVEHLIERGTTLTPRAAANARGRPRRKKRDAKDAPSKKTGSRARAR